MWFLISISFLSLLAIFFQYKSSLEPSKNIEKSKMLFYTKANYLVLSLIVVCSLYLQMDDKQNNKHEKYQGHKLHVLEKVDMILDYDKIIQSLNTIEENQVVARNYLNWNKALKNTDYKHDLKWENHAGKLHQESLKKYKNALGSLHDVSFKIIMLDLAYPNMINNEILNWANTTINISLVKSAKLFDTYRNEKNASDYAKNTGKIVSLIKVNIREIHKQLLKSY